MYQASIYAWFWIQNYYFLNDLNIFEPMEIAETIYEGAVKPYYKKPTIAYANRAGHISQTRGVSNL